MFESLSDKLRDVLKGLRGESRLTEENIDVALRNVRIALLEADVNYQVVKQFIDRTRERALGTEVALADARRGDLVFFPGHVGIMQDSDRLLHANAFWMNTVIEPLADVVARGSEILAVRRL